MDYLDLLQWPAMLVTITAAWLVASSTKRKRTIGFWVFLVSNVLWSVDRFAGLSRADECARRLQKRSGAEGYEGRRAELNSGALFFRPPLHLR
jgi:hypothetical protein